MLPVLIQTATRETRAAIDLKRIKVLKSVQKGLRIDKNEGMYVGEPKGMVRNVGMLSKTTRQKRRKKKQRKKTRDECGCIGIIRAIFLSRDLGGLQVLAPIPMYKLGMGERLSRAGPGDR